MPIAARIRATRAAAGSKPGGDQRTLPTGLAERTRGQRLEWRGAGQSNTKESDSLAAQLFDRGWNQAGQ